MRFRPTERIVMPTFCYSLAGITESPGPVSTRNCDVCIVHQLRIHRLTFPRTLKRPRYDVVQASQQYTSRSAIRGTRCARQTAWNRMAGAKPL